MTITTKFYPPFIACVNKLKEKYGEEFEKLNGFHNSNLNFTDFIDKFTETSTVADSTIDPNANSSAHDVVTLTSDMMKPHTKLIGYNKVFFELVKKYDVHVASQWLENEWSGAFYMHDSASISLKPYCYSYDLEDIARKGLYFINKFKPGPARHLSTFCDHVLEFVSWSSNRQSGACGLPTFLYHSYYFWLNDVRNGYVLKDPETYRRQYFQKFIYDLNQPYLRVSESAFTTITVMDREYLTEVFGGREFPNGELAIDHIDEIIEHQKVFMEVLSEIRQKCMMTFPVLTYSLIYKDGKFQDEEFARWCSDHNSVWYDSNFQNDDQAGALSGCCRLRSDNRKLKGFMNTLGGANVSIGSIKVNTINLRRISIESGLDEDKFLEILKDRTELCVKVLDTVRNILKRNVEKGLLPNYTDGLMDMRKQFSTIGITAMYEVMSDFDYIEKDLLGYEYYSQKAIDFAKKIFEVIDAVKDSFTDQYSFNIEAIPGETANVVLSKKDRMLFSTPECVMYSNQWIPLTAPCTVHEKIRLGSILDPMCSGGQIAHINLEGPIDKERHWDMLNRIAASGLKYFAFNPKISVCGNNHGFFGEICPECGGEKVDTFSRIVGYLVPTKSYSASRKEEFGNRKWFQLETLAVE